MKVWHIVMLNWNKTLCFSSSYVIFCFFTWSTLTSLLCCAFGHWSDSFQFSIVWGWWDPLLAQSPCLMLHWLDYFYLILVLPSVIGIVKRPCEGMTHALGTSNNFTTKVWCLGLGRLWTKSFDNLMTFIEGWSIGTISFIMKSSTRVSCVNECCDTKSTY